jgi:gamma-glutamyltranspeptidase/glutathione hydrolase
MSATTASIANRIDWENPYLTLRRPTLARNVVSTSQPLAAQAGLRILLAGGNAVDAALATAITLTVTEPISNGIGSDAFAIVWDGKALHGLNASGRSPAGWTPEYFDRIAPNSKTMPMRGWNSVTVPGAVSAWHDLWTRFGRLPFERLFEPAIEYAERGFHVSPFVASRWAGQVDEMRPQPPASCSASRIRERPCAASPRPAPTPSIGATWRPPLPDTVRPTVA